MKRSEAFRRIRDCIGPGLQLATQEILELVVEAAGPWDPEEEPMAERLSVLRSPEGIMSTGGEDIPTWWVVDERGGLREAEAREAAAIYNRRGAIADVARELRQYERAAGHIRAKVGIPASILLSLARSLEAK